MRADKQQLATPVILIFFNRPYAVRKVFEKIRESKPRQLFLVCDGPRPGNLEDVDKILQCQEIVKQVDWSCKIYKNYAKSNMGCGLRVSSGLSWVFEKVDSAIILEDDCVPSDDFFPFCAEMIERYRTDERVMLVSGMNHLGKYSLGESYHFSKGASIWGWATWKRAWDKYFFDRSLLQNPKILELIKNEIDIEYVYHYKMRYIRELEEEVRSGKPLSSWYRYWHLAFILNSGVGIVPKVNMITNIGGGPDSTHFVNMSKKTEKLLHTKRYKMNFPLVHPQAVICDRSYDIEYYKLVEPKIPEIRLFLSGIKRKILNRVKDYRDRSHNC